MISLPKMFLFFLLALCNQVSGQSSLNLLSTIGKIDVSKLWKGDSISIDDGKNKIQFPEPIGFIGDDYQRFYIHYTSVVKSPTIPFKYIIKGKTKRENQVCSFRGTITIIQAKLLPETGDWQYQQGTITANIDFYEDSIPKNSGRITGRLETNFYFDNSKRMHYDALMFFADGFSNNECTATWKSYKTGKTKICNWGDFRIPKCGDLDVGAGEFGVNDKYIKNGWQNYMQAWLSGDPDDHETIKARNKEQIHWWK